MADIVGGNPINEAVGNSTGELVAQELALDESERHVVTRSTYKIVPIFVGDAFNGYPQATPDEQRLLFLRDTVSGVLSGSNSVFQSLVNRALMGEEQAAEIVDKMVPHITALATIAGVKPPREHPMSKQERNEWLRQGSELTAERQRGLPARRRGRGGRFPDVAAMQARFDTADDSGDSTRFRVSSHATAVNRNPRSQRRQDVIDEAGE